MVLRVVMEYRHVFVVPVEGAVSSGVPLFTVSLHLKVRNETSKFCRILL